MLICFKISKLLLKVIYNANWHLHCKSTGVNNKIYNVWTLAALGCWLTVTPSWVTGIFEKNRAIVDLISLVNICAFHATTKCLRWKRCIICLVVLAVPPSDQSTKCSVSNFLHFPVLKLLQAHALPRWQCVCALQWTLGDWGCKICISILFVLAQKGSTTSVIPGDGAKTEVSVFC